MTKKPPPIQRRPDHEPGICPIVEREVPCRRRVVARGLCQAHRRLLGQWGLLDRFGTPSRQPERVHLFARNEDAPPGRCPVLQDGVPCTREVKLRGLCGAHYQALGAVGRLEELAAPRYSRGKSVFAVEAKTPEGSCWIVRDGQPCRRSAGRSGVCERCRMALWYRSDLRREDFTRRQADVTYSRKKQRGSGVCVVRELLPVPGQARGRFRYCESAVHVRGLCRKHLRRLAKNPALLRKIADPARAKIQYRLKADLKDGVCVVVENGVGCVGPAASPRRVCHVHRLRLEGSGVLRELTDRFVRRTWRFERKPEPARVPGFCLLLVDGVPCTGRPRHRGLCHNCYQMVRKHAGDSTYETLALPPVEKRAPLLARKDRLVKGVCALTEDGVPCPATAIARGLCQRHYRTIQYRRRVDLDTLGLSPAELSKLPDVPHYYLDKNVPIRFAVHEIFHLTPDRSSVALVNAVLARRVRATVSLDCVRALYSHVGHRLARPIAEGGRGFDEATAERFSREYTGKLFFGRGGLWNFLASREESFRECAFEGHLPGLSLEDALELHLFAVAKREHGAELFVTADAGILKYGEAVHPERVVREQGELSPG